MLESSHSSSFRGGDDGVRTVECLRGRLLAERVASKAAKDEADLLSKRLEDLERQLGEEIKYRNRAEKILKYALKKLESLKLSNVSQSSEGSSTEMRKEIGVSDDVDSRPSVDSANKMVSQEGSWSSVGTGHSRSKESPIRDEDSSGLDCKKSITDDERQDSFKTGETNSTVHSSSYSDDRLALVPVGNMIPQSSSTSHSCVHSDNVQDVLLALRHVKLRLRNSLERRAAVISPPKVLYGQ